ncbi:hypothetical protein C5Y96_10800 [Blastopirellula marina]|uniref:Uncharacterized protein n=1 Tax=Blastopirellula marina TaxID=124 RepID=A0A2S8FMB5_9BACT|nr:MULTISPECIES: hypothetical protein [Pirellulaceae]PQO33332.1 hypothetical protein C5Y96_10800 [Blastopirellula marina]RCS52421.1 hypothetical protein DTL36_10810 [Bremerella cremea]
MSNPDVQVLLNYTISVDVTPVAEQNARHFTELMKQTQAETTQILKDAIEERAQIEKTAADIHQQDRLKQLDLLEDIQKQATELVELQQTEQTRILEDANRAREEAERDSLRRLQEQHEKHLETAKEETKEIEHQLAMKKSEQERIELQLLSARQRFGQMDEGVQQQTIAAFRKAQNGGALTRDESSLLRNVGTQQASEFAQKADLARADAAGFTQVFGAAENDTVEQLIRDSTKLKLELDDKREIEVQLNDDLERMETLASRLAEETAAQIKERDERLLQRFIAILEQKYNNESGNF